MKEHIISAIITFISTFLTTLGTLALTMDITQLNKSTIFALVISAFNVAIRAGMKVVLDK